MAVNRPLPTLSDPDTGPFWAATKDHQLRYQVCNQCKGVVFYPRRHCTHCLSLDLAWKTSKGEGTVYTYSVIRQTRHPAFVEIAPYAIAWIDLDEGFRMLSNITGVADPTKDIKCGQRVRVEWLDQDGSDICIPVFRPV